LSNFSKKQTNKAQKGLLVPINHLSFFTEKETLYSPNNKAKPSIIRSFQPPITRQMIMLPLHGQSTAAVKNHRAETTFYKITKSNVFENSRSFICRIHK